MLLGLDVGTGSAKALLPKTHKTSLTPTLRPQRGNFKLGPTVGKFRL